MALIPFMLLMTLMLDKVFICFPSIPSMVNMVEIGRSKFGQNNRISLVEGLPELLNLEIGDYVVFHVSNGNLIIEKDTKKYHGIDFEGEEIRNRLIELEKSKITNHLTEDIDPEELAKLAREEYLRDKELREKAKRKH